MKVFVWLPTADDDREAWPVIVIAESVDAARAWVDAQIALDEADLQEWRKSYWEKDRILKERWQKRTGQPLKWRTYGEMASAGVDFDSPEARDDMSRWRKFHEDDEGKELVAFAAPERRVPWRKPLPDREPDQILDTDVTTAVV